MIWRGLNGRWRRWVRKAGGNVGLIFRAARFLSLVLGFITAAFGAMLSMGCCLFEWFFLV